MLDNSYQIDVNLVRWSVFLVLWLEWTLLNKDSGSTVTTVILVGLVMCVTAGNQKSKITMVCFYTNLLFLNYNSMP